MKKTMIIISSGLASGLVTFSFIGLFGLLYGSALSVAAMLIISIAMGRIASDYD
jgi:hypothetical protein